MKLWVQSQNDLDMDFFAKIRTDCLKGKKMEKEHDHGSILAQTDLVMRSCHCEEVHLFNSETAFKYFEQEKSISTKQIDSNCLQKNKESTLKLHQFQIPLRGFKQKNNNKKDDNSKHGCRIPPRFSAPHRACHVKLRSFRKLKTSFAPWRLCCRQTQRVGKNDIIYIYIYFSWK